MKVKKRLLKKLLFVITLTLVLSNCYLMIFGRNVAFGVIVDSNDAFLAIETMMSGLVWIFTIIPRLAFLILGFLMKLIMNTAVSLGTTQLTNVTYEHVFFSGYRGNGFSGLDFTDINFFDLGGGGAISSFRTAVAQWYYIMRLISVAILLVILIYVGIRMAISTIASEQAKYKQMLIDWITSLALLFLLHYIIIFVISINTSLVSGLGSLLPTVQGNTVGWHLTEQILTEVFTDGINGIFAAIIFCVMQGQAFGFFLFYVKRMITIGFLIIIAPLITITYSIDKIGDGKAQALNAWLKELIYNILIQPFHCVIYLAFFGAVSGIIANSTYGNVTVYILVYVILKFMKEAEGILRKIFHFEANSMPSITEPAKGFAAATGKFAQVGMKAGFAFSNFRAAGGLQKLNDIRKDFKLKKHYDKEVDKSQYASFEEYRSSEEGRKKQEEYQRVFNNSKLGKKISQFSSEFKSKKESKLEQKAQSAVEANMTEGEKEAFREVYNRAKIKKANGEKLTKEESEALEKVDNKKTEIKENTPKKKINGVTKKVSEIAQSDLGKLAGAYAKDSAKVAAAIALGGFAYGMTDNATDALSFGQLGYGLAYGALEGTVKTTTDDTAELIRQYAHNNNISPEEMHKLIQEFVNECHSMDFAGMFKKIHDDQVKALDELKKVVGDSASEIMSKMIGQTKIGEEYDIANLIETYSTKALDDAEKIKAMEIVKNFSNLLIQSQVAGHFNVVKAGGMDVDSFGRRVTNHYNTTENNTTNYIYNYEENKYESKFSNN